MPHMPTILNTQRFVDLPTVDNEALQTSFLELLQEDYRTLFSAKTLAKISRGVTRVTDSLNKDENPTPQLSDILDELSTCDDTLKTIANEDLFNLVNERHTAFNYLHGPISRIITALQEDAASAKQQYDNLTDNSGEVYDSEVGDYLTTVPDPAILERYNKNTKIAQSLTKTLTFIESIPQELSALGSFPTKDNMPTVNVAQTHNGRCATTYPVQFDEYRFTSSDDPNDIWPRVRHQAKSIEINGEIVSAVCTKVNHEMGTLEIKEQWLINDKPMRVGDLPAIASLRYDPSAEDLDPTFTYSHPALLASNNNATIYKNYLSRHLACEYVDSNSDYYRDTMHGAALEIQSTLGDAILASKKEAKLAAQAQYNAFDEPSY